MVLIKAYKTHPQLMLCGLLLVLVGCIGISSYIYTSGKNRQIHISHYGQVLAETGARQAVNATLQQDFVSLQAILQEVCQYPNVVGATIHNVENKLLSQSGFKPSHEIQGRRYSFSAPIALYNNIAGYLEVTLDVPSYSEYDYWFFILLIITVSGGLLTIGWSIHRQWWSQLIQNLPSSKELMTKIIEKIPQITLSQLTGLEEKQPSTEVSVRLCIDIVNLNKLYEQLNSESFAVVLRRFEKQLHNVLHLYTGLEKQLSGDRLLIDFNGERFQECCFRAVCCAQLLANLTTQSPSPRLQLAAAIYELSATNNNKTLLNEFVTQHNNHLKPDKGEIFISQQLIDENLLEYLEVMSDSGKLIALKPPYALLLTKQLEQLVVTTET